MRGRGGYLKFNAWFLKNVRIVWRVKDKNGILWKTEIVQDVLKLQYISLLTKCMKRISRGIFLLAFSYETGACGGAVG